MNYLDDLSMQQAVIPESIVKKRKSQSKSVAPSILTDEQRQIDIEDYLASTVSNKEFYERYGQPSNQGE
jgi:hypothetical protein|tara:strand:+ start:3044 stop:3250 length:207 start_codon:yes stop_codon:yes gene_type:complete